LYRTVVAVLSILEKFILTHEFEEVLPKLYKTQIFDCDKLMKLAFGLQNFKRESIAQYRRAFLIDYWKRNPPKARNTSNLLTNRIMWTAFATRQLCNITIECSASPSAQAADSTSA